MDKTAPDRLASAAAALFLQALFIALMIYSQPLLSPPRIRAREITFILSRLRDVPRPSAPHIGPSAATPLLNIPPIEIPQIEIPPIGVPPPAANLQGFGRALFGCAPENLINLTAEQRSHCSFVGVAPPDDTAVAEPASHVKDPARRAAELAARNTPARVPCTQITDRPLGFGGNQDIGVMADTLCVLKGWFNGYGGLPP